MYRFQRGPASNLARGLLLTGALAAAGPGVAAQSDARGDGPTVRAGGELLSGAWSQSAPPVAAFRGIPFAAPPVGAMRWRAPGPHVPRQGPQDATRFAPACMQGSGGVDWYVGVAGAFGHGPEVIEGPSGLSEDCLYLNVWTPRPERGADLPVLVFVHGGGNSAGWSYEPNYRGSRLAARGAVVVTVAYRLGPFGFFAHPALGEGETEAVANFGLLDIRSAFEWVRQNIEAFGGDPERVTAFGESAGGLDLMDLLLADAARGRSGRSLFGRLIVQSIGGSLVERQDLREEREIGSRLVESLGLAAGATAAELQAIPAADLLAAVSQLPGDWYPDGVVDGRLLPATPVEIIRQARFDGVELLIGTNAHEWLMYVEPDADQQRLQDWIAQNAPGREAQLLAAVAGQAGPRPALDRLETAQKMLCPSRYLAREVNQSGGRAWVYYFSRIREGQDEIDNGRDLGAYHGAELPYIFDTHDDWLPTTPSDERLTAEMSGIWLEFARRGHPAANDEAWPPYTAAQPVTMELGESGGPMAPFDDTLCGLLGPDA